MPAEQGATSVKVRMYRQGFGDCFLLSFYEKTERVFTMLIDCGIKYNSKSEEVPIADVIADLEKELTPEGGDHPVLDVLVATHEHWDHISFFHPTRSPDYFKNFEIKHTWLAWTENPEDEEAKTINSRLRDGAAALQLAAHKLQEAQEDEIKQIGEHYTKASLEAARTNFNKQMEDVVGFYGVTSLKDVSESGIKYKKNGKVSTLTEQAMENIIKLGRKGGIKYLSPGTTVDESIIPGGINVYVLGPPRNSMINKSNPSRGHAHETYFGIDNSGMTSFIDGLLGMNAGSKNVGDSGTPFGDCVGVSNCEAAEIPFWKESYYNENEAYRRVDHNWLDIAGQFALQLDGAVNNTSLVLAIEIKGSGKVLLFPGDAQVGSWLSWHDYEWKVKDGDDQKTLTIENLLANTALYKVSHHGSHNATIKDGGLELMTHNDLVAMVPEKEDSYSGIPYDPLMTRLHELCKGRVLVSADVNHQPEKLKRPTGMSNDEWKAFKAKLTIDRCYVEYTVD